jgi:recombination protein RecA
VSSTGTTVLFINQLREKVGVLFGSQETTSGGKALKFYASVRLDVRRKETLKLGDVSVGNRVKVKVVKNKLAPPFRQAEFDLIFGEGISRYGELVDLGVETGALLKSGTHYATAPGGATLKGIKLGNGKAAAREYLAEHADVADILEVAVRQSLKGLHGMHPRLDKVAEPEELIPAGSEPPWADPVALSDGALKADWA